MYFFSTQDLCYSESLDCLFYINHLLWISVIRPLGFRAITEVNRSFVKLLSPKSFILLRNPRIRPKIFFWIKAIECLAEGTKKMQWYPRHLSSNTISSSTDGEICPPPQSSFCSFKSLLTYVTITKIIIETKEV